MWVSLLSQALAPLGAVLFPSRIAGWACELEHVKHPEAMKPCWLTTTLLQAGMKKFKEADQLEGRLPLLGNVMPPMPRKIGSTSSFTVEKSENQKMKESKPMSPMYIRPRTDTLPKAAISQGSSAGSSEVVQQSSMFADAAHEGSKAKVSRRKGKRGARAVAQGASPISTDTARNRAETPQPKGALICSSTPEKPEKVEARSVPLPSPVASKAEAQAPAREMASIPAKASGAAPAEPILRNRQGLESKYDVFVCLCDPLIFFVFLCMNMYEC